MTQLTAFVGHSFLPDDEAIVRHFLNHFDVITKLGIGFTWDHAKDAASQALSKKVKALMDGKNLFIGICTKREAAIDPEKLSGDESAEKRCLDIRDVFYKTSDWVIQEIGFAIGRNMELILLVEKGVRKPGGLQGDIEYIEFDRTRPEKCHDKLLQMIGSLRPKISPVNTTETAHKATPQAVTLAALEQTEPQPEPSHDWNRSRYEPELLRLVCINDAKGAQAIYDKYLETGEGKKPTNRERWEAYREGIEIAYGDKGNLTSLEQLATSYSENWEVQRYLAVTYGHFKAHEREATQYQLAADKAESAGTKLALYAYAIRAWLQADRRDQANDIAMTMRELVPQSKDGETYLIQSLCALAEADKDYDQLFGLMERLLQLRPDDLDERFSLAYKFAQQGQHDLSLLHYLRIPDLNKNAYAWNNLGVEFDYFKLVGKSIRAYRSAQETSALAKSNLAHKFMDVGFLDEAQQLCDQALTMPTDRINAADAALRLSRIPQEEEEKQKKITAEAARFSDFYQNYGRAIAECAMVQLPEMWKGPECELSISLTGKKFVAEGQYDQMRLGLNPYAGSSDQNTEIERRIVKYEGSVQGRAIKCTVTRRTEHDNPLRHGLLDAGVETKDALMIICESMRKIKVYENVGFKDRKLYAIDLSLPD